MTHWQDVRCDFLALSPRRLSSFSARAAFQCDARYAKEMRYIGYSGALPLLVRVNHRGVGKRDLESRRQHYGSIVSANRWREKHLVIEAHHVEQSIAARREDSNGCYRSPRQFHVWRD